MRFWNWRAVCHFYYDPCFSCLLCCEHDFAGVCACVDGYLNVLNPCITYRRIYEVGSRSEELLDLLNTGVLRQHFFGAVFQNYTDICLRGVAAVCKCQGQHCKVVHYNFFVSCFFASITTSLSTKTNWSIASVRTSTV